MFASDTVSATTVRIHAGKRCGCLTALLDTAKVAAPVLALRLWQQKDVQVRRCADTRTPKESL